LQVTVSGDGLIHEVVNGLFERSDWREAFARIQLGVIPGGTGNALSRTLIHEQVLNIATR
jgi:sphingosine kinase